MSVWIVLFVSSQRDVYDSSTKVIRFSLFTYIVPFVLRQSTRSSIYIGQRKNILNERIGHTKINQTADQKYTVATYTIQCSCLVVNFNSGQYFSLAVCNLLDFCKFFFQIGQCWAFYILVCDLNKYFSDVLNLPVNENGFYSSLPFAMMWVVAIGTGFLSDFVIHRNYLSVTSVRKLFTFISKWRLQL